MILKKTDVNFIVPLPIINWKPNAAGVYLIINTLDSKAYVGSSLNLRKRFALHKYHLRANAHHSPHLQNAWNLHGEENFQFAIIKIIDDKKMRLAIEQTFINIYHQCNKLYNGTLIATSCEGIKRSEETKVKLRLAMQDTKRKEFIIALGKAPKSEEQKELMRIAALRRPPISDETRNKLRESSAKRWAHYRENKLNG